MAKRLAGSYDGCDGRRLWWIGCASSLATRAERRMLLFKKKFLPAIRSGEKTQTIRLWKWRQMKAGQRSYIPGAGYVRIDAVDEVQLADLADADAVPDGFATADALRQELQSIYGDRLAAGFKAFRVVFHVTEPVTAKAQKHQEIHEGEKSN